MQQLSICGEAMPWLDAAKGGRDRMTQQTAAELYQVTIAAERGRGHMLERESVWRVYSESGRDADAEQQALNKEDETHENWADVVGSVRCPSP